MTTIVHGFVSAIADDATAKAKGEVLPSHWNAVHTDANGNTIDIALTNANGNLTFYVATTGSDSNPGTALLPFRTIQHALNVCASFDYQNLYFPTVNVADGNYAENVVLPYLLNANSGGAGTFAPSGFLTGNTGMPTNCKIAPTGGVLAYILWWRALSNWKADGFSLVADPNISQNSIRAIRVEDFSFAGIGNIDFNMGSTVGFGSFFLVRTFSRTSTQGNFTFQGTAGFGSFGEAAGQSFMHIGDNTWTFNSSVNISGYGDQFLFTATGGSQVVGVGGITFVNPGNITGAVQQFFLANDSSADMEGIDPTTVTWPGLATFTPTGIDATSNIDGFFYANQKSGLPANTDLYKGTWGFFKDTSGGGVYAAYNDAGTIKKVALT